MSCRTVLLTGGAGFIRNRSGICILHPGHHAAGAMFATLQATATRADRRVRDR